MSGNVWEWVEDAYKSNYTGVPLDGTAYGYPEYKGARVLRGGSWSDAPVFLRASDRYHYMPGKAHTNLGFRIARTEF